MDIAGWQLRLSLMFYIKLIMGRILILVGCTQDVADHDLGSGMVFLRVTLFALMVICLIYSVSIYMVGSGTFSFVIWLAGAAFLGLAFFLAGNGRWMKLPEWLRGLGCSFIVAGLVVFAACMIAMIGHFKDRGVKDLDYIIVLGAQMRGNAPSIIFKYRLDAAYEYLLNNPGTVCIVSGGRGWNEFVAEGEGGKDYLVAKGISADRIIAESKAVDTRENIRYSLDMIGQMKDETGRPETIGILTNNFHVFRAVHLAKGMTEHEIHGIAVYTLSWYLPNNMVRECFGIIRDFAGMKW